MCVCVCGVSCICVHVCMRASARVCVCDTCICVHCTSVCLFWCVPVCRCYLCLLTHCVCICVHICISGNIVSGACVHLCVCVVCASVQPRLRCAHEHTLPACVHTQFGLACIRMYLCEHLLCVSVCTRQSHMSCVKMCLHVCMCLRVCVCCVCTCICVCVHT